MEAGNQSYQHTKPDDPNDLRNDDDWDDTTEKYRGDKGCCSSFSVSQIAPDSDPDQRPHIRRGCIVSGDLKPGADFQSIQRNNQTKLETTKHGRLECRHPTNKCGLPDWCYSWLFTILIFCFLILVSMVGDDVEVEEEEESSNFGGFDDDEEDDDSLECTDEYGNQTECLDPKIPLLIIIGVLYVISSCCLCCGRVAQSVIYNSGTKDEVDASVQKVKENPVKIYISVICSHHESDGEGSGHTVITYSEQTPVSIGSCLDLSKGRIDYGHYHSILIRQTLEVCCGEPENANKLEEMRLAALERCKGKDKSVVAEIQYQIKGFKELLSVVPPERKLCINRYVLCLSNILLISPLWYMWFYLCGSGFVEFQHKKVFFFNQAPTGVPQQGQVQPFAAPGAGVQMMPMGGQPGMMPMAQQGMMPMAQPGMTPEQQLAQMQQQTAMMQQQMQQQQQMMMMAQQPQQATM
uniref:Uncharacterized protein n=1 Tax=Triparma pacifica TaxID=91992 RepID=A0A7S2QUU9_9STRA|mmetsp:Transcript_132/g.183  ORF Transcript_132/g.183 Transcript_132/m.183 type:complete len:464 (+) Transcript_132:91-1482(+)